MSDDSASSPAHPTGRREIESIKHRLDHLENGLASLQKFIAAIDKNITSVAADMQMMAFQEATMKSDILELLLHAGLIDHFPGTKKEK
jgi:hypothetical protein